MGNACDDGYLMSPAGKFDSRIPRVSHWTTFGWIVLDNSSNAHRGQFCWCDLFEWLSRLFKIGMAKERLVQIKFRKSPSRRLRK